MINKVLSWSIRTHLILFISVLALPSMALIVYSGLAERKAAVNDARKECISLVTAIAAEQEAMVAGARQLAETLALLPDVQSRNGKAVDALLSRIVKENPRYATLGVADKFGTAWATNAPYEGKLTMADRRYFQQAVRTGIFSSGEYIVTRTTKKPAMSFGYPVRNASNELISVITVSLDLGYAQRVFEKINLPPGGSFNLLDHRGVILLRNLRDPLSQRLEGKADTRSEIFAPMKEGPDEGWVDGMGNDGRYRIGAYKKLRLPNESEPYLYIRAGMPLAVVTAKANAAMARNVALLAALLGVGLLFVWFLGKRLIVNPVTILKKASEQLKAGTTTVNASHLVKTGELGDLACAFDDMAGALVQREATIRESEQRWATTLSSIGDALIATDVEGKIMFMNGVAEGLTGWTLPDASRKPVTEVFHIINEHTRSEVESPVTKVLREGMIVGLANHTILVRKDGTQVPIDDSGAPIRDADGKTMGVVLVFREITERKRAEEALRESEERFRTMANALPQLAWIAKGDGYIFWYNQRWYDYTGTTPKEMEGWGWQSVHDPQVLPQVLQQWKASIATGMPFDMMFPLRSADGQFRQFLTRVMPLKDTSGKVIQWFGTNTDVTEHKQMEEELRRSRDELEARVEERTLQLSRQAALLDLAHDAIIVRTSDGKITFWSSGAEATYGFTREEAIGKTVDTLLHTKFPLPMEEIMNIVEREKRWEGELIHRCKVGKQIVVLSRWTLRKGEAGGPAEILEINRDITERKQAEQLLRRGSAYNRSLLETSLDPLVTIDPAGKINDVNAATERVTGYPRERLIGTDFSDYFTDPARARAGYTQVFEEGFVRDYRLEIRHGNGQVTPVLYNASVYRDEGGSVLGVFAAARDITEQLRLEEQLRQAQKMEAIGTLAGGIAHDFNNILAAIIGFTEMVLDDVSDNPFVQQKMERVLKAGIRGRDLVRQILAFSRKTERERKEISLTPLVKETHALLRSSLPRTIQMNLAMTTSDDHVVADPTQLQQVLMNLATNAAHAIRETGGLLTIELSSVTFHQGSTLPDPDLEPGTYVKLTVKDTGTGMTEEVRQRIFEPFFTTKEQGKGTGMGLAVVHGVVKSHGGAVTVQSELGQGSTFEVFLPRAQRREATKEEAPMSLPPTGTERILFVDDEELLVEMTRGMLEGLGYQVTVAASGSEAWNLFLENPSRFDLIITDQTMPDVTGLTLAQKMLKVRKDTPIILCTGYSEMVSAEKAKEVGICEFVMKPVVKKELAETIRRALDGTKAGV